MQCVAKRAQVALGSGSGGNNSSGPPHGPKRARAPQHADFPKQKTLKPSELHQVIPRPRAMPLATKTIRITSTTWIWLTV